MPPVSRRAFLERTGFLGSATALLDSALLSERGWLSAAEAATVDEITDTFNGLLTFIADDSALANGLGGPNPTLTTQALATRTAEKIFQLYFDGAPWVSSESPVSSIDPRVTRAVQVRGL